MVNPFHPGECEVWEQINTLKQAEISGVVVTVAAARGSVPTVPGAKMLVDEFGRVTGTVGGGKVEAAALAEARSMLKEGVSCCLQTWNLQRDIGMTCGGEMTVLFESWQGKERWHVVLFGAGHVSQAVASLLGTLSCRIDVIDERRDWLDSLSGARNVTTHHVTQFADGVVHVHEESFVLALTKGHSTDRPVLKEVFSKGVTLPFVGVIGSASKRATLWRELREDGVSDEWLSQLVCPLGLPLGGNEPAEIAVSVVAQLLEIRDAS